MAWTVEDCALLLQAIAGYDILVSASQASEAPKKPALTVMAALVPAICSDRVPRLMAGTSPAMTVKVTTKANQV